MKEGRTKGEDSKKSRKAAGAWIKLLRERRKLSQSDLARILGSNHYTFISQVEIGRIPVPPDRMRDWASALGCTPYYFARELLRYYEPFYYNMLFKGTAPIDDDLAEVEPAAN